MTEYSDRLQHRGSDETRAAFRRAKTIRASRPICERCRREPTTAIRGDRALCRACAADDHLDHVIAEQKKTAAALRARAGR